MDHLSDELKEFTNVTTMHDKLEKIVDNRHISKVRMFTTFKSYDILKLIAHHVVTDPTKNFLLEFLARF